jgi:hypothetical protein
VRVVRNLKVVNLRSTALSFCRFLYHTYNINAPSLASEIE